MAPTPKPQQGVLGTKESAPLPLIDSVSSVSQNEKPQGFEKNFLGSQHQSDPIRTGIAIAVLLTLLCLGVGAFFLRMSRE